MPVVSEQLRGKRAGDGGVERAGAHFARVLAAHGAEVVLAARRAEALEALARGSGPPASSAPVARCAAWRWM